MSLTRDEIVAAITKRRQKVEEVDVPEWGGSVFIRLLSTAELKKAGYFDGADPADLPVKIMVACLSDKDGKPLFDEKGLKDLTESDFITTVKVFEAAAKLNGLGASDVEKAAAAFGEAQPGEDSSG